MPIPKVSEGMDNVDHPLLDEAKRMWNTPAPSLDRLRRIKDNFIFKCKPRRSLAIRGAIWCEDGQKKQMPWLLTAGPRSEDSFKDFYKRLEASCKLSSSHILPTKEDANRLLLEVGNANSNAEEKKVQKYVAQASRNPEESVKGQAFGADIELVVIENGLSELYIFIDVIDYKSNVDQTTAILRAAVPIAEAAEWEPDYKRNPDGTERMFWWTLLAPGWDRPGSYVGEASDEPDDNVALHAA